MNDRLACSLCGQQPCLCVEAECRACDGEGKVPRVGWTPPASDRYATSPSDPPLVDCEPCDGTGQVKCDGPRSTVPSCRLEASQGICHCEAAWERAQEAIAAGDGPPTTREQQVRAQEQRDALRSGRPI